MTSKKQIKYIAGVKYSLAEDYFFESRIIVKEIIRTHFFDIFPNENKTGSIWHVRIGYPWDGPSGPTIDTKDSMRPSLEHDIKYEAIRKGLIDKKWKLVADEELRDECIVDGMDPERAKTWHIGVSKFAGYAADPKNKKKILTAP